MSLEALDGMAALFECDASSCSEEDGFPGSRILLPSALSRDAEFPKSNVIEQSGIEHVLSTSDRRKGKAEKIEMDKRDLWKMAYLLSLRKSKFMRIRSGFL